MDKKKVFRNSIAIIMIRVIYTGLFCPFAEAGEKNSAQFFDIV